MCGGGRGLNVEHVVITAARKHAAVSEDASLVLNKPGQSFFATVVDGHGFKERHLDVAEFARFIAAELADSYAREPSEDAIPEIFAEVDRTVAERFESRSLVAVAACVTVVDGPKPKVTIAHAGDCRLYRFSSDAVHGYQLLTQDHRVDNEEESARLKPLLHSGKFRIIDRGFGAFALDFAKLRLQYREPSLGWSREQIAVTRGFAGLHAFRPALTSEPDVTSFTLNPERPFLFALCSDGGKRIVQRVFEELRDEENPSVISLQDLKHKALAKLAAKQGQLKHDLTIIFIRVSPNLPLCA